VVRPRASSGTNGSGVELRFVDYKGQESFIEPTSLSSTSNTARRERLRVADQLIEIGKTRKAAFMPPALILSGRASESARRLLKPFSRAGVDCGNFAGVALWYDGRELRLVSQLSAGWYRYISDWRLRNDGGIGPRFGFAGTLNPCTCNVHTHHAYWRLDLT